MPIRRVGLAALAERLRGSLFFVPMLGVVTAVVLGQVSFWADEAVSSSGVELPRVLQSTVDSARAVLSTVAAATITFAGIAFSVSLLVVQLASSQYSPRVVHSLLRDPVSRRVMGIVLGTFTYCLVVLRLVRDAADGGEAVVPSMSVMLAVLAGLVAILATVAFINHSAHAMEVGELLHGVTEDSLHSVALTWPERDGHTGAPDAEPPSGEGFVVRFERDGWIQQADDEALLTLVPPGGTVRLETAVGHYAVAGMPLCTVWPDPGEPEHGTLVRRARAAVFVGEARTLQQDASYGIRQLADVGLRALSPGVNDPTTAQEAIFHQATVLRAMLERDAPPAVCRGEEGRRLLRPGAPDHDSVVSLAFDELRVAASSLPTVSLYLLEAIAQLCEMLEGQRREVPIPLREQARLVVEGCEASGVLPHDKARVRRAYEARFGGSLASG